jgi:hypothetical protein
MIGGQPAPLSVSAADGFARLRALNFSTVMTREEEAGIIGARWMIWMNEVCLLDCDSQLWRRRRYIFWANAAFSSCDAHLPLVMRITAGTLARC